MPRPSEPPDPVVPGNGKRATDAVCAVRLQTARVETVTMLIDQLKEETQSPIGNHARLHSAIENLLAARRSLIGYRDPFLGDAT